MLQTPPRSTLTDTLVPSTALVRSSRIGKKMLVIDRDLRRPKQHNKFGVKNGAVMSDLLTLNKTAAEVVHTSKYDGVFFIPSGGTPPNPAELLAGASARSVIEELEKGYDVLLIDSPPTLGLADAVEIGALAEGSVFVMEAAKNQASHARNSLQRLARSEEHTSELQSLMRNSYAV